MTNALIQAWKKQSLKKVPYRFNDDADVLRDSKTTIVSSYNNFIKNDDYADISPTWLHLGLRPVPFVGDLAKADIFIALINPGFVTGLDHYAESIPELSNLLLRNLKQKLGSKSYPFFMLDPKWHWTGAGTWWHRLWMMIP